MDAQTSCQAAVPGDDSQSPKPPLLTVIVPVYNEASTIEELLRRVIAAPYSKQIVVVDDGSTDGTNATLDRLADEGRVELCRHDRNRGKGRAIRTALERARGRFVIVQDGDLETDPEDYAPLIQPFLRGCADFVIGSRFASDANLIGPRLAPMRLGVSVLNVSVHALYGHKITDEACCYKVLATETLRAMDLRCERFEFCSEVVAKASRMKLRIVEVPVRYYRRNARDGKKLRWRDGIAAIACLWRLRRWTAPQLGQIVPHSSSIHGESSLQTHETFPTL
jgi:dolichol-phosphate mannosyltransferase